MVIVYCKFLVVGIYVVFFFLFQFGGFYAIGLCRCILGVLFEGNAIFGMGGSYLGTWGWLCN